MSLMNGHEILKLLAAGVVENAEAKAVNAASLDLHLGDTILRERDECWNGSVVPLRERAPLDMRSERADPDHGWVIKPGEFILAHTREVFYLPRTVSAEYKLKSSMARIGLEHLNAGWCDAGWTGSVLTLELKNMTRFHSLRLRPGDRIGQIVFFKHGSVSEELAYSSRGTYNHDTTVTPPKPLRHGGGK